MTALRSTFLVAVVVLALGACGGPPAHADVSGLRLQRTGSAYPTITGWVVNHGQGAITSADVAVTLYDADNRPLDDVLMQVRNVSPGDSVRFERRLDLDASGAKLKFLGVN